MLGLFIDSVHLAFGGIAISSNSITAESFLFDMHNFLTVGLSRIFLLLWM